MNINGLVLTDNEKFARMLQHEMSYMRISLEVISDEDQTPQNPDFKVVLADLDFCGNGKLSSVLDGYNIADLQRSRDFVSNGEVLIIGWSRADTPEYFSDFYKCSAFLRRPFLMADLRYIVSGYFALDNVAHEDISVNNRLGGYLSYISRLRTISESQVRSSDDGNERHLTVDKESMTAIYGEMKFPLSEYEYKTLSLLCEKRGEVVSREDIARLLQFDSGNMGDVYICHLRKKIDNTLGIKLITTVRGKGYMLK